MMSGTGDQHWLKTRDGVAKNKRTKEFENETATDCQLTKRSRLEEKLVVSFVCGR